MTDCNYLLHKGKNRLPSLSKMSQTASYKYNVNIKFNQLFCCNEIDNLACLPYILCYWKGQRVQTCFLLAFGSCCRYHYKKFENLARSVMVLSGNKLTVNILIPNESDCDQGHLPQQLDRL